LSDRNKLNLVTKALLVEMIAFSAPVKRLLLHYWLGLLLQGWKKLDFWAKSLYGFF